MRTTKSWIIALLGSAALLGALLLRNAVETPTPAERARVETSAPAAAPETAPSSLPSQPPSGSGSSEPVPSAGRLEGGETAAIPVPPAPAQERELGKPYPFARVDRAVLARLHGDQPLTSRHPHVKSVKEVKDRHAAQLLARPGVVGAAVGLDGDGRVAVVVMTKEDGVELPRELEGHPVVVWKTGPIASRQAAQEAGESSPQAKGGGKPGGTTTPKPEYQKFQPRPVPIGISTGLPTAYTYRDVKRGPKTTRQYYITAGTIGCRVKDGSGVTYALSNFHVYSWDGVAPIGAKVLQPGTLDGNGVVTEAASFLGYLTQVVRPDPADLENRVDGAIAATSDLSQETLPDGYGEPSTTTASAALDVDVSKYGRTTGYTSGTVMTIDSIINVDYGTGMGVVRFIDQIGITDGSFSAGGDSGSLIVTSEGNQPVGLLFAGGSTATFANRIDDVLSAFEVVIDGQ